MSLTIEAVYENGIFRPVGEVGYPDHQRVRLEVEALPGGPLRQRGSAESLKQAFADMDGRGRVNEAAWARLEDERKAADLIDLERTVTGQRQLLDPSGA